MTDIKNIVSLNNLFDELATDLIYYKTNIFFLEATCYCDSHFINTILIPQ